MSRIIFNRAILLFSNPSEEEFLSQTQMNEIEKAIFFCFSFCFLCSCFQQRTRALICVTTKEPQKPCVFRHSKTLSLERQGTL